MVDVGVKFLDAVVLDASALRQKHDRAARRLVLSLSVDHGAPMLESSIAAAKAAGARLVLPGTVYNYGPDADCKSGLQ